MEELQLLNDEELERKIQTLLKVIDHAGYFAMIAKDAIEKVHTIQLERIEHMRGENRALREGGRLLRAHMQGVSSSISESTLIMTKALHDPLLARFYELLGN